MIYISIVPNWNEESLKYAFNVKILYLFNNLFKLLISESKVFNKRNPSKKKTGNIPSFGQVNDCVLYAICYGYAEN